MGQSGWVPAQPGSGAQGGGEGRMDCSHGTGSVTGQQWAPPQPAVPLLFAEGPAALSPTGTMAGACSSQQSAAVCPESRVAAGPMMLTLTPHCWVPQSLATPQGGRAPSWGAPMALLPCVLCCPLCLSGTGLAGGPEHQAPQLAAVGGRGRLALAPLGYRSRA